MSEKAKRVEIQTETCGVYVFSFYLTPAGAVIGGAGCAVFPKPLEDIILPTELNEQRVIGIAPHAFAGCDELQEITLPKWLDFIGEKAFSGCSSLACVRSSEGIIEIGISAFEGCEVLSALKMPKRLCRIGARAFAGCRLLPVIKFCDDLEEIGEEAFCGCVELNAIFFAETTLRLGAQVFQDTAWWKKQPSGLVYAGPTLCGIKGEAASVISIQDGTLAIAEEAFVDCERLKKVELPVSLAWIDSGAFCGCPALTEIRVAADNPHFKSCDGALYSKDGKKLILCPGGKTRLEIAAGTETIQPAFLDCGGLKELVFPEGVLRLAQEALCGAVSLVEIVLRDGLSQIGDEAFEQCVSVKRVVLPKTLIGIGHCVFSDMEQLASIEVADENPSFKSVHGALLSKDGRCFIAAPRRADFVAVPDGVEVLAAGAFEKCVRLKQVMLPGTLKVIEASAFEGCTELQELILPESLRETGLNAFRSCSELRRFVVSEHNTFFAAHEGVLYSRDGQNLLMCPSRQSVCTPLETVRYVADFAFEGCTALTQLEFGAELKTIGESAFRGCRGVRSISFLGNAPLYGNGIYEGVGEGFTTFVQNESKGWNGLHNSTALPQMWCGYPIRKR